MNNVNDGTRKELSMIRPNHSRSPTEKEGAHLLKFTEINMSLKKRMVLWISYRSLFDLLYSLIRVVTKLAYLRF